MSHMFAFSAGDVLLLVTVLPMAQFDLRLTFQGVFVLLFGTKRSVGFLFLGTLTEQANHETADGHYPKRLRDGCLEMDPMGL